MDEYECGRPRETNLYTYQSLCTNATNVPVLMLSPFSMLWGLNSVEMFVGEQNLIVTATTHMFPISTYIGGGTTKIGPQNLVISIPPED